MMILPVIALSPGLVLSPGSTTVGGKPICSVMTLLDTTDDWRPMVSSPVCKCTDEELVAMKGVDIDNRVTQPLNGRSIFSF